MSCPPDSDEKIGLQPEDPAAFDRSTAGGAGRASVQWDQGRGIAIPAGTGGRTDLEETGKTPMVVGCGLGARRSRSPGLASPPRHSTSRRRRSRRRGRDTRIRPTTAGSPTFASAGGTAPRVRPRRRELDRPVPADSLRGTATRAVTELVAPSEKPVTKWALDQVRKAFRLGIRRFRA